MHLRFLTSCCALAVLSGAGAAFAQPDRPAGPGAGGRASRPGLRTTWEYRALQRGDVMALAPDKPERDRLNGGLNKVGAEGWELVAASGGEYVFKRPAGRTPQVRTGAWAGQRNTGPRRPIADAPGFRTFQLKNASAADMERILAKMFAGGGRADGSLRIASYEPTNSVIVWGAPPQMEAIEALLNRLDTPEGGKAPPRK